MGGGSPKIRPPSTFTNTPASREMWHKEGPGGENSHLQFKRITLPFYLLSFGCGGGGLGGGGCAPL